MKNWNETSRIKVHTITDIEGNLHEAYTTITLQNFFVDMGTRNSKGAALKGRLDHAKKTGNLNLSAYNWASNSSHWPEVFKVIRATMPALKMLDISENPIETLPPELRTVSTLRNVQANRCGLISVYDLVDLTKLTTLGLSHNRLTSTTLSLLPVSVVKLDLSHNALERIPESIALLKNLIELNISHNALKSLLGLGALSCAIEINADNNQIEQVEAEVCVGLVKLKHLSLQNNQLFYATVAQQCLPRELFERTQLDQLDLRGNDASLTTSVVLAFEGISAFIDRRKARLDKALQGGAIHDTELFGLP